jgi:limonene-1,2-epoxide hydrolase
MSASLQELPAAISAAQLQPNPREQRVTQFFACWGESYDSFSCAFEELLADDCVWDQRPIPRLTGPAGAIRFLRVARAALGLVTVDVEILHVASAGDVVHVDRIDRLRRADGSLIAAAPVAGVMQFRDDRVVYWREYFDSAEFVAQTLLTSVGHLVCRALRAARAM